jgi:hypothetical protein
MCRVGGAGVAGRRRVCAVGRRLCARCLSAKPHAASSSWVKSAPTDANRFGGGFIFVEIRFPVGKLAA